MSIQRATSVSVLPLLVALAAGEAVHLVLSSLIEALGESMPAWAGMVLRSLDSAIAIGMLLLVAWIVIQRSAPKNPPSLEQFQAWMRWCAVLFLAVVVFPTISWDGTAAVIGENIVAAGLVATSAWGAIVLLRVLRGYRTARTSAVLRSMGLVILAVLPIRWIEELVAPGSLEAVYVFQGIAVCAMVLVLSRRRRWLQITLRENRWRLAWWCSIVVVLSVIAAASVFDGSSVQSRSLGRLLIGSDYVVGYVFLGVGTYALIALWTVLGQRSSGIRQTLEFDAITFFNRMVSEHADRQQLNDTVVTLAVALTDATAAMLVLLEDKQWEIAALAGIDEQRARALELQNAFNGAMPKEELVVPWLQEDERFYQIARSVESYAQSLMLIPLWEGTICYGGIVVISNQPFAFEHGDIESLAAFAPAVTIALANQRLLQSAIERERLQRELMLGREIQQKLLPTSMPLLNGWEVAGWSEPALEVGGDYFDYFVLGDGTACVVVADVSGKGISAAFYMAKLKGVCLALAPLCQSVRDFVVRVHQALDGGVLEPRVYISLVAVGITPRGAIHIMRAGHPPPLGVTARGKIEVFSPPGIALGMVGTERFAQLTTVLEIEQQDLESIVLFSDGLLEAGLPSAHELGLDGIRRMLGRYINSRSAQQLLSALRADLTATLGQAAYHDDITAVIMKRFTTRV